MKTKKSTGKLKLNKKTIADLKTSELKNVHGGVFTTSFANSCMIGPNSGCLFCSNDIPCGIIERTQDC